MFGFSVIYFCYVFFIVGIYGKEKSSYEITGITYGSLFTIKGTHDADPKSFVVDFFSDGKIPLQYHVDWSKNKVLLNSFSNSWIKEVSYPNTFKKNESFVLKIRMLWDKFYITVNDHDVHVYKHKLPLYFIEYLNIEGDVRVGSVKGEDTKYKSFHKEDFPNGHLKTGQSLVIHGVPLGYGNFDLFVINFYGKNGGYLLHFNPRFKEAIVALNVKPHDKDYTYGAEERYPSPFVRGKPTKIKFTNKADGFHINVDDKELAVFKHRTLEPSTSYKGFIIDEDFDIRKIEYV